MKISIITGVFNRADTIEGCIKSVFSQSYPDIEYIIIDGGSTDGTLDILNNYSGKAAKIISEPDQGIYYALNKGIGLASGDIIGFLHSDDFYAHRRVVEIVAGVFEGKRVEACYGDLLYVSKEYPDRVIRRWEAGKFYPKRLAYGWMLPHPTFFVKKSVYQRYGCFNTDFKISADYELMLRFLLKHKISVYYINEVLINMRMGGISNNSLNNLIIKSREDYKAWKSNGLVVGPFVVLFKNLIKLPQFVKK